MKLILDASCLYNTRQAGYKYFASIIPYLVKEKGMEVVVTPSPTGIFDTLENSGVKVQRRFKVSIAHLPLGPFRKPLSNLRGYFSKKNIEREAAPNVKNVFHSFFYTPPPNKHFYYLCSALDAIPEKLGGEFLKRAPQELLTRKKEAFQKADHLVAISHQTKKDVCEVYGIESKKISVIHLGVNLSFYSEPVSDSTSKRVRKNLGFDGPFFLQVGGRQHHKNFKTLLEAYAKSPIKNEYRLVSAGEPWEEEERALLKKHGLENRVTLLVHSSEEDLKALYKQTTALVYPSLYEGFGMPIVEAMASGTPVLASQTPVLFEVGGEAIRYFSSLDSLSLSKELEKMTDAVELKRLKTLGLERAQQFSWQKTATELAKLLKQTLG